MGISSNLIYGFGAEGIYVSNGNSKAMTNNGVRDTGTDEIVVTGSFDGQIVTGNPVRFAGDQGS
jgi:hypothetical protein